MFVSIPQNCAALLPKPPVASSQIVTISSNSPSDLQLCGECADPTTILRSPSLARLLNVTQ